jgi:hypothetical protein
MPKLAPGKAIWSAEDWIHNQLGEGNPVELDGEVVEPIDLRPEE